MSEEYYPRINIFIGKENVELLRIFDNFLKRSKRKNAYGKDSKRSIVIRLLIEEYLITNFNVLKEEDKRALYEYFKARKEDKKKLRSMSLENVNLFREKLKAYNESLNKPKEEVKKEVINETNNTSNSKEVH